MENKEQIKEVIESGKAVLGLEFGSTRIKAVLIDEEHHPIASGDHEWENRLDNGIWTYTLAIFGQVFAIAMRKWQKM